MRNGCRGAVPRFSIPRPLLNGRRSRVGKDGCHASYASRDSSGKCRYYNSGAVRLRCFCVILGLGAVQRGVCFAAYARVIYASQISSRVMGEVDAGSDGSDGGRGVSCLGYTISFAYFGLRYFFLLLGRTLTAYLLQGRICGYGGYCTSSALWSAGYHYGKWASSNRAGIMCVRVGCLGY